ncbi:MAG: ABC transporter permease subunit [Butyrivibrio sp.]|nr:ABC transporter permease subunit [Butyrivibrio sp.]
MNSGSKLCDPFADLVWQQEYFHCNLFHGSFPILYLNTLEGLKSTDVKLLEMAKVYRMPGTRLLRYIYLPQLKPFFKSAFKLAIGMSFKSGIAAEVIGQPLGTIGNGLYLSKIYLETADLFAWTIVVVLISFICEKLISLLLDLI